VNNCIRIGTLACLATAAVAVAAIAPPARAAYTITLTESAGNVVASGSGSFNLTSLTPGTAGSARGFVQANNAGLYVGPSALTALTPYGSVTGPASFGSGGFQVANSGSGNIAGIDGTGIVVPTGYISGTATSGTATWTGKTFGALGVMPGTYVWTWGTGPSADSLVLQIGPVTPAVMQPIPTLSRWGMVVMGSLLTLGAIFTIRRRRS
jgi:IPTL-CTERM motif